MPPEVHKEAQRISNLRPFDERQKLITLTYNPCVGNPTARN